MPLWRTWKMIVDFHEHLQSSKQSQIRQELNRKVNPMSHTTDTHWKGCPNILYLLCDTCFPPWKTKVRSTPKHNNFFATSSLVSLPHFINATIIALVKLLLPNPSTIHSTWSTIGRLNHICMNTNPRTTIYVGNFITQDCYEPSNLDDLDNDLLNLDVYEFSKSLAINVRPMHWRVLWDIQTLEELIKGLILQH